MAALFWDLDSATTPPQTPALHFRHTSPVSFYDRSHCSSPVQDNLDWPSSEQVEFTRLNPSRTKDKTEGEWHMVTATRSLLGQRGQREGLQDQWRLSYNSLPRAHFLQPNRESSAFSPYANDFCLNGSDAKNIAESPRNSRKLHPLTQPGFYSPKIPRSKHCEAAQSTKTSLKGSSSTNNLKEFFALTLPLACSKTAVLETSPLCSKPQKVKTFLVEKPPLMRAVVSQTSPTSNQPDKEHFSQLQPREDHLIKNQDCSLFSLQEPNRKPLRNDQPTWSQSQNLFTEEISTKDHLSINTLHLFPERQSRADQPATLCPKLEKASHEIFTWSVDTDIKPSQSDPDRSCQLQASPAKHDCSPKQKKTQYSQHGETSDVRNTEHNHVKSQVDVNSKNVFGQPRVTASLRAACSPRPVRKSTVVEDLKKLIVMDDTEDSAQGDSSSLQQKEAELCRSLQMSSSCTSLLLFSQAYRSYPESPPLTPIHLHLQTRQTECGALPEQAEFDLWDRDQHPDPELMPLPSTACDLDWNSLVQAAQEYETQRMAALLSEMSPVSSRPDTPSNGTYKIHQSSAYCSGEDIDSDVFIEFPDQLSHLEGMLRRLSSDLLKEKRDKVALLAEVLKLRISNQHLREESLCACAQLHKISNILNTAPGEME
ncbi:signal-induced proliferation-associated 1-like protein 3 [Sinocyclocheilus anshuiensis]|uniref:signal-induced proliferation-associated 1-like protein 3 n=1 Tax=Sinocyclocheilus anshuiensis TaxID=1608454 RepID=UPI0007B8913E|nr:PREDICTED: signal-induced proliferation-associated 1-like protein 3 [Sinocyclocheilus anshuiensis]